MCIFLCMTYNCNYFIRSFIIVPRDFKNFIQNNKKCVFIIRIIRFFMRDMFITKP